MKALFFDDRNTLGEGFVVRELIKQTKDHNDNLCYIAQMKDGQEFEYKNAIIMDDLKCPKCKSNEHLVFRGDTPDKVTDGYVGACLKCEEDFYLFELQDTTCTMCMDSIIHNFNIGDTVTVTNDRDDYEDNVMEDVMLNCEGKKLTIDEILVIDKELVHYFCKDENGMSPILRGQRIAFIDADLIQFQPIVTCFNANNYTTRQLIEMEFENLPDSEHKDNMIDEALQLVEECGYTVGEAANEVLSEAKGQIVDSITGIPQLQDIKKDFLSFVGHWINDQECRTGENRTDGTVTYNQDGLYLYEFQTREDAFKYLFEDSRSVPYAIAEYYEEASIYNGEETFDELKYYNGFNPSWIDSKRALQIKVVSF